MFDALSSRFNEVVAKIRGRGRLTEDNIQSALREVRMALLEADVALPVVREFIDHVRERAVGREVLQSLTPGQALVKVVHSELVSLMGASSEGLKLNVPAPAVILVAGLQGAGKTTTVAKLAKWLGERERKKVLVTSTDVYRPAAIDQLEMLSAEVGAQFYRGVSAAPVDIAKEAVAHARHQFADVLLLDTAGRLHVDTEMMGELQRIAGAVQPVETLFVVDSMTGQDAVRAAAAFNEALALTGVILTKTDGDARGGAALSVRHVTGKPIKFIGVGEKVSALESFHPERVASRILGMGDILSLVEEAERTVDRQQAERLTSKLKKGGGFDLEDFRDQLQQIRRMGGVAGLMDKLPGLAAPGRSVDAHAGERDTRKMEAIINSMTPQERRRPAIIKGSRKRRIAGGSGTQVQDVNRLLRQFEQMQRMMKQFSKGGGMNRLMRGLRGRLPGMGP